MADSSKNNTLKKRFTICGYSIWEILAYFVIYSIVGFIIETLFGVLTKGVLESRKGFLYGPFCPIYGVGGLVLVLVLKHFKKNNYLLFLVGMLVGGGVEYVISFLGEAIFNTKWWDYSDKILNINGRICLEFCIIWGFLAIYLVRSFQPMLDMVIAYLKLKINTKLLKGALLSVVIFLIFDLIMTCVGLKIFYSRLVYNYDLEVHNKASYIYDYNKIRNNDNLLKITNKVFSNKFMLKTFPNLKMDARDGSVIYVAHVLKDIQPYYIKLFTPEEEKIYHLDDKITQIIKDKFVNIKTE